jgi:hypothetical protein
MSALSISNHLIMRMLQRQNTKRVIAKRMVSGDANGARDAGEAGDAGDAGEAMETTENNFPSIVVEGGANDATNDGNANITASKKEPLQVA